MAAIFLDLDGTLTDPKPGITGAIIHALETLGLDTPHADELEWAIGPPLLHSFARLGAPDPERALAIYRDRYTGQGLFDAHVYPGIPQALDAIQAQGHRQILMTAKPHIYAKRITAKFALDRHMSAQFGPELDGTRNDKAELLAHALDQLAIDPVDAVMIGDREYDLAAARGNGMRFVGAMWGYGTAHELDGADALCAHPDQLATTLLEIF